MNYFEVEAISRGTLVAMLSSPRKARDNFYEKMPGNHFDIGILVDNLITNREQIEDIYHITKEIKPTGKIGDVAYNVLLEVKSGKSYSDSLILEAREKVGYNRTMKQETFLKTFKEESENWILEQTSHNGKIVVDKEVFDLSMMICMSISSNPAMSKLLTAEGIIFQPEFYWDYRGWQCKAKPDFMIKNENEKTILLGDIKTTGNSTAAFRSAARKERYDIQASWYTFGGQSLYKDYTFLPFVFLVETTEKARIGSPLLYETTKKDLDIGRYGAHKTSMTPLYDEGERIKGFEQLFEEFVWHSNSGLWTYSYAEYTQNNKLKLDIWQ